MIAALLLIVPHSPAPETCDLLEVNYVLDLSQPEPRLALSQVIARDLEQIRDWKMLGKVNVSHDWERGCWRATWVEGGRIVEVRSPALVETWSDHDRELIEREWLPECQRKRISR